MFALKTKDFNQIFLWEMVLGDTTFNFSKMTSKAYKNFMLHQVELINKRIFDGGIIFALEKKVNDG